MQNQLQLEFYPALCLLLPPILHLTPPQELLLPLYMELMAHGRAKPLLSVLIFLTILLKNYNNIWESSHSAVPCSRSA